MAHGSLPPSLLREARSRLHDGGAIALPGFDANLAASWQRSRDAGLAPTGRLSGVEQFSGVALQRILASNRELLAHSRPVMEYLFSQVRESNSIVVLSDRRGVLMHTLGDTDFVGKAERVSLTAGASWHEQQRGTNAIGTALVEQRSLEIHGGEHFLERNGFLTCAASPLFAANGELLGILDISGDHRARHPHTLSLVNTAARMIENRLVIAASRQYLRLHVHTLAEGIGSVGEGILTLTSEGEVLGGNRQGLALLGLGAGDLGQALERDIEPGWSRLMDQARQRPGIPFRLRRRDGRELFAQLFGDRPPQPAITVRETPAPTADALSRLDTGDARWQAAAERARRVMGKPIPLLLQGESGVGKELLARAVHESSPRRDRPFVAINCAALPENLIEAELFGYQPGAFTGARKEGSLGRLREADGGTLFLDEIGDMPMALQTRLLRVLQERQVAPLGGGPLVSVDFALISATHHTLREEAEAGRFRRDLYYRINGLSLHLPALRERSDFAALAARLLNELEPEAGLQLSPGLADRLARHDWPGNLRQLASALRTAVAMLDPGETCIDWHHLTDDLLDELRARDQQIPPSASPHNLAELSRQAIQQALEAAYGNLSAAARQLGISRQTLYRKLKTLST